jgi:predicted metalloprotease with PDZ domain
MFWFGHKSRLNILGIVFLWISFGFSLNSVAATESRVHQYSVVINDSLSSAQVTACFHGLPPKSLKVSQPDSEKYLLQRPKSSRVSIPMDGLVWDLSKLEADACISYISNISGFISKRYNAVDEPTLLSFQSKNSWLWLPEEVGNSEVVQISFQLPARMNISTPWKRLAVKSNTFKITTTPIEWDFNIMIGDLSLYPLKLKDNKVIEVAILSSIPNHQELIKWINYSANTLLGYLGHHPFEHLQIMVLENKQYKNGPVPWGDVKRGGGLTIRYLVNSDRPIQEYYSDWTATHEFAHLILPNLEYKDAWLAEGLASYLQYILMGQAGTISPNATWKKLQSGFLRGATHALKAPQETLQEAVINRHKKGPVGRTKRLYWSGAIYFLEIDIKLRKLSQGKQSLANVLAEFTRCCTNHDREWSGKTLVRALDNVSGTTLFSENYFKYAFSKNYPEHNNLLKELGVSFNKDEQATLSPIAQQILTPLQH